jgi:glucose/arabinose dehydrogenase
VRSITLAALAALVVVSCVGAQVPALTTSLIGSAANGLSAPLYVCAPPGDLNRLFVVEKGGRIKVRTPLNQTGVWTTCLDISTLVSTGAEQGLLGMAFHPSFASNGYFYVCYTSTPSPGSTVVRRYTIPAGSDVATSTSGLTIISIAQPFTNHNGGSIQFGPDGYLYMATGDGGSGNDPNGNGQNLGTMLGKMLRIDVNVALPLLYANPTTNPFYGATAGLDEIWAYGLRNPFRFSFDRLTGDLWIGDVGQDVEEEVDFQPATNGSGAFGGRNYGWRCREGNFCTGLSGCTCTSPTLTNPVTTFSTSIGGYIAIIGGNVYRGCLIPQLRGHYLYGEYSTGQIWRLTYDGTTITSGPTLLPFTVPTLGGFGEDGNGELYVVNRGGNAIYRIVPVLPQMVGVTTYGTGTAGCNGAHAMSLGCSPTVLNLGETIVSTNGPPGSMLIGVVSAGSLPPGSDPLLVGVETLIDVTPGAHFLYQAPVAGNGIATVPTPIPNAPWLAGVTFYVQHFFSWTTCSPSPLGLSSSVGVAVTIQP